MHLKRLVVVVMVSLFQKFHPVPLYSVLASQLVAAVQQFGEQVKVDEIAIQTAPRGNWRQVLGCIHSFVIIGVYSVERPLSVVS